MNYFLLSATLFFSLLSANQPCEDSGVIARSSFRDHGSRRTVNHMSQIGFFVERAKRLLDWNREKLTRHSDLKIEDLEELFAANFVVKANERVYDANHENYFEFLGRFRADIDTIDYEVQEYLACEKTVVMPLYATVKRPSGREDIFDAIMLVKFNDAGKIVHWQEVYSVR